MKKTKKITPAKKEKKAEKQDRRAEAKAALEKDRQERIQRTAKAIADILDKEGCEIDIAVVVSPRGNFPQLNIIAKE